MSLIGVGALQSRLKAIGQTQQLMRRLAIQVVAEQKRVVPRKTGNLARTIHVESVSATHAQVVASANYAAVTNFGSRPHDILPVRRKALRFAPSAGGRRLSGRPRKGASVVFAKRVRHPGTKGTHWAERGAQNAVGKGLADVIVEAWNRAG